MDPWKKGEVISFVGTSKQVEAPTIGEQDGSGEDRASDPGAETYDSGKEEGYLTRIVGRGVVSHIREDLVITISAKSSLDRAEASNMLEGRGKEIQKETEGITLEEGEDEVEPSSVISSMRTVDDFLDQEMYVEGDMLIAYDGYDVMFLNTVMLQAKV